MQTLKQLKPIYFYLMSSLSLIASRLIKDYKHVTIFPMAIPSIASPGAIMAVVLMTDNHIYSLQQQAKTTVLVLIVVALTCLLLLTANKVKERVGEYGITVVSKIMGLILASYAVQSILSGLKDFFVVLK